MKEIELYLIRQCKNNLCNFRYPAPANSGIGVNCPKCKYDTEIIHHINLTHTEISKNNVQKPGINLEIALDNIRSTFNVGAIFRSADGVGIKKLHLCGITPSPTNIKVLKTSLGSEKTMNYESHHNALTLVKNMKQKGYRIWALEITAYSHSIFDYEITNNSEPTLLVIGNEITGIDPDVLNECELHLHIPMVGIKNSLNVAIAFGIAVYSLVGRNFSIIQV
ncbi:MAG: RNA methyltransferase [Anaerolineaceae bacterium]|nr:RNA methyltransferase [Anaerolineaceae bacterium]